MEITDVRIFLKDSSPGQKLKAYATITFDNSFVVRNVKVIEGNKGLFVAMPSERVKEPCPKCGHRNVVRSRFCNQCGEALTPPPRTEANAETQPLKERSDARLPSEGSQGGQARLSGEGPLVGQAIGEGQTEHRDIAHPITTECREIIQRKVLEAYEAALRRGQGPK